MVLFCCLFFVINKIYVYEIDDKQLKKLKLKID